MHAYEIKIFWKVENILPINSNNNKLWFLFDRLLFQCNKIRNKPEVTVLFMFHLVSCCHQLCTTGKPAWKLHLLRNLFQCQVTDIYCKHKYHIHYLTY